MVCPVPSASSFSQNTPNWLAQPVTMRHPIAHWLYSRVLELEAQLEVYVTDVQSMPDVQSVLNLLQQPDAKKYCTTQLQQIGQKCLDVMKKYRNTQLPFYDEVRVFDPRQRDTMPKDIKQYTNLFSPAQLDALTACGEWRLYWKQCVVDSPEFHPLEW